jgi:hypothetical protein
MSQNETRNNCDEICRWLTPPKPKSILDSDEFRTLMTGIVYYGQPTETIKQFIRDHFEEKK